MNQVSSYKNLVKIRSNRKKNVLKVLREHLKEEDEHILKKKRFRFHVNNLH